MTEPISRTPSPSVIDFLNSNPAITWILVVLFTIFILVILFIPISIIFKNFQNHSSKPDGLGNWLGRRGIKAKIGPVSFESTASKDSEEPLEAVETLPIVNRTGYELSFDYADFKDRLHQIEKEKLDSIQEDARGLTRQYTEDFIAQMKIMNQIFYSKAIGKIGNDARDHHFNTICRGEIRILIPKELLDIFDRNHLLKMSESEYKEVMEAHFERIRRLVSSAFSEDWYHPEYPFEVFQEGLDKHVERGIKVHMLLMNKFRALATRKLEVQEETIRKTREVRNHVRQFGCMPDNFMNI